MNPNDPRMSVMTEADPEWEQAKAQLLRDVEVRDQLLDLFDHAGWAHLQTMFAAHEAQCVNAVLATARSMDEVLAARAASAIMRWLLELPERARAQKDMAENELAEMEEDSRE